MENTLLEKYAHLLTHYCLEIQRGDQVFIRSTFLAEDLLRALMKSITEAGGHAEFDITFREQGQIFMEAAEDFQLKRVPPFYKTAIETFDAFLAIRAPYNLRSGLSVNTTKRKRRLAAMSPVKSTYFERTADRSLKRSLCQFPTQAAAQEAEMSLSEYEQFVFGACRLFDKDPQASWLQVREDQQRIVDHLNTVSEVKYQSEDVNVSFSVQDRTWINSDGRTNMPSGEVFSAPVEDSVNGIVHFSYPSIVDGHAVEGITLWIENGRVEKWEAKYGQEFLDQLFKLDGARYFGEVAIGTNYNIQTPTKNILFDEKMGGTIHMAVGQSYIQTGGKNQSPIHVDMIADMKSGGAIFADGEMIYENGKFLI